MSQLPTCPGPDQMFPLCNTVWLGARREAQQGSGARTMCGLLAPRTPLLIPLTVGLFGLPRSAQHARLVARHPACCPAHWPTTSSHSSRWETSQLPSLARRPQSCVLFPSCPFGWPWHCIAWGEIDCARQGYGSIVWIILSCRNGTTYAIEVIVC